MTPDHGTLHLFDTSSVLAEGVANWFCEQVSRSDGRFVVNLSGGSTPKQLYELLSVEPFRGRIPWQRVIWTFGDERFVPHDDEASNYGMVRRTLFDRAPVPAENIYPFQTTGITPEESASAYEHRLYELRGSGEGPIFDLTLLGMGDDGHTASLIPGQPVLDEREHWAASVPHGREHVRLTLTFPALNKSRVAAFLISGAGKRATLDRVLSGDQSFPAGQIRPEGELHWFVDRAAAGRWAE